VQRYRVFPYALFAEEGSRPAQNWPHSGLTDYRDAVKSTRLAVGDLTKLGS
jgi:hypothetical protein